MQPDDAIYDQKTAIVGASKIFSVSRFSLVEFQDLLDFLRVKFIEASPQEDKIEFQKRTMISIENEMKVLNELVELCVELQSQYPRSPFEDYELLNSGEGLS